MLRVHACPWRPNLSILLYKLEKRRYFIFVKTIFINRDELFQKYKIEKLSQKKLAEYFNCSVDTIVKNLKDYEIPSNKPSDYTSSIVNLNDIQKEALNGAMLGDGSLIIHKHGLNAYFSYLSKSSQHTNYIANYFNNYITNAGVKNSSCFDNRTKKTYNRTSFKTIADEGFTKEYYRWYKNGKKHIPNDLILTPLTCLVWYIGDGCICNHSSDNSQYIKLATQCFIKEELEQILIPQLSQFEPKLTKADRGKDGRQQYFIYIPHRKMKDFFNYIGQCPFSDYQYKWNYKDYESPIPKNYGLHEQEFCKMYKNGMSCWNIAKQFNIDYNVVKYYLIKNNLFKRKTDVGLKLYEQTFCEMYKNGMSCWDIAKQFNINYGAVRYYLVKNNLYKQK